MKSFENWDVYFLYEYAYSFMLHGDGDIFLIYFENEEDRFCYVVMQKDIADAVPFAEVLEKGKFYDWETPYGYGGPLADSEISIESQKLFNIEIQDYCAHYGVVTQFIRFHPLMKNYGVLPFVIESRYLRDTIFIDTTSPELILSNMDSKNRNMVLKAKRHGITIVKKEITEIDEFIPMYVETMEKNGAEEYYVFDNTYFESLSAMKDNAFILYALYEDRPISGSIMYYNDRYMHYHLSGSYTEDRKYAPNNLLLYVAACWASEHGIGQFHLGGGMALDDSLFRFKKRFNKNGRASFVVGRTIFNQDVYERLLNIRKGIDSGFDINNGFMIQYRR